VGEPDDRVIGGHAAVVAVAHSLRQAVDLRAVDGVAVAQVMSASTEMWAGFHAGFGALVAGSGV